MIPPIAQRLETIEWAATIGAMEHMFVRTLAADRSPSTNPARAPLTCLTILPALGVPEVTASAIVALVT